MMNILNSSSKSNYFKTTLMILSLHAPLLVATTALAVDEVNSAVTSVRSLWHLWNLIVIILCITRRKKEIGGWLLYYYIQLYSAAIFSIFMFLISLNNYLPVTWGGITGMYILFLFSTIPSLLIIFIELYFAERLRKSRKFDNIRPFRIVLWFHFSIAILGLLIDSMVFKDNVPLAVISLIYPSIWLPYFYKSKRVDRVFRTRDWIINQSAKATG